ncbi:unnamed protein product [Cylicocyclus nassatus]|uniref:ADP-ribosylation factor-like protein 13B n=1 Tax=Cylicocyclus nassatus TaxID=53992 RepID=A0AA36M2N5_CYLNA|nr:unnamed protein product [Cylicocyclus nassatus]
MGLCCCTPKPTKEKREIKIGCFGVDGAGKTTILKMIKGEDPRNVLPTNGFSMIDMDFDNDFTIKVYDLGGHERIRDIWPNYFAEVHGIMYVVDISDEERLDENYEMIHKVQLHKDTAKKPLLVVLNKKKPTELDDFDFSMNADLNAIGSQQNQVIFVTHVNIYRGELNNIKRPPPLVSKRPHRASNPLLAQFCTFVDKIIEHYVFLSEGVHAAELALKIRQQAERDERRLRLMQQEHEKRNSEIAGLQQYPPASGNGDVQHEQPSTPVEGERVSAHSDRASNHAQPDSKPASPGSAQPSATDTQSPTETSPRPATSHDSPMSGDAVLTRPLPVPPPKPARNRVVPVDDGSTPRSAPKDQNIFTIERSNELNTTGNSSGREKHLNRMRRIQSGLQRKKPDVIQLQPLDL